MEFIGPLNPGSAPDDVVVVRWDMEVSQPPGVAR